MCGKTLSIIREVMRKIILVLSLILFLVFQSKTVYAVSLDEVTKELEDLKKTFSEISSANNTNEATLNDLNKQLQGIKVQVGQIETAIDQKEKEVKEGEKVFTYQKELLNARAKSYYKNIGKNSLTLIQLLLSDNLTVSLRNFFYGKTIVDEDRRAIVKIVMYIKGIEEKKKELETEQAQLTALKADVEKQSNFLAGEVTKTKAYLGELSGKIAELAAERDRLIAGRLSALNLPQSAYTTSGGCSSDLTNGKDPGFSPRFGFFTFGVPHRVGMSQYGAWGRAKANQNEETILRAYYNFDEFRNVDTNINIKVNDSNGFNSGNIIWNGSLEEYMKRIYEIPCSWTDNNSAALKAQAISVRSYVLSSTNNGDMSICATQYCQVFKVDPKTDCGGSWVNAVNDTPGKVMVKDGNPISAYYSSTAGGYTYASGGDLNARPWTKNVQDGSSSYNSFDDVKNNGYDRDSPWFYCDWGSRSQYGGTAWLTSGEVADIVNVTMLALKDGNTIGNLYQTDKPNPAGKETWDTNKVKEELKSRGLTPFNSIDSISVSADFGGGRSGTVTVSGDAGTKTFDAWSEFKTYFNQRAPANIQIVGPLFNVEKR